MTNEQLVELVRNKYGKKFKVLDSEGNPTGEYKTLPLYYPVNRRTDLIWPEGYAELDFPVNYYNPAEVYEIANFMRQATLGHNSVRPSTNVKAYFDDLNTYVYTIAFRLISDEEIRNFGRDKSGWTAEDLA